MPSNKAATQCRFHEREGARCLALSLRCDKEFADCQQGQGAWASRARKHFSPWTFALLLRNLVGVSDLKPATPKPQHT